MSSTPVALVTGASRGIGRGIALALAREGFSVGINYANNREAAQAAREECAAAASAPEARFELVQGNVGEKADRDRMLAEMQESFGSVDALVNNAGIPPRERADILDASEESFEELMRVNLQGPYFLTQAVARSWLSGTMKPRIASGFKVVFVGSISADTVSLNRGEYCVSKAGAAMASKLWAVRLAAENVQVYEVRPGITATDMTAGVKEKYDRLIAEGIVPQRRWGVPDDTGKVVASLLRGDFLFSTGEVINVDGAFHISRL